MTAFTVGIPPEIKDTTRHTVRVHGHGTEPETLGRHDLKRARETLGYAVYRWSDTDASGTPVILTRMDNNGQSLWLYATYLYTRVPCKVCRERKASGDCFAAHYVLLIGKGMNTTGAFPLCDDHLAELRRQTAGGRITVHVSERLIVGHH